MEIGSEAEVSVDAVDEAGNSFSRDHGALTSAIIESSDPSIIITKYAEFGTFVSCLTIVPVPGLLAHYIV